MQAHRFLERRRVSPRGRRVEAAPRLNLKVQFVRNDQDSKGTSRTVGGSRAASHCSLRWTPHCLFVPSVDRFHILLLKWMINLERTRGDCGNETKAVMAGLMSFKPSFYDELKRQLSSSDVKLQISSLRPEEAQWNATESQNSCL